jgi:ABC-type branched-subunit amino acid transport system ATPase component
MARTDERRAEERALAALAFVGLDQGCDRLASELTAHEQRLLMIASALATEPRVLLLDEPAAGASAAELERLADLLHALRDRGLGLLVIEHNLRFVRRVADLVTVLEAGRRIARGTLAEVAADEAVRTAYLGRQSL